MRILLLLLLLPTTALADVESLTEDVAYLADDARQGRRTGSEGMTQAKQYVIASLQEIGLTPVTQPVGKCHNVMVTFEGSQPETYIVVGAHLDHMGNRRGIKNGADDNASGSAALLDLARRIVKVKPRRNVVLVWFTGEEQGFVGSKAFIKQAKTMPVFMLNMDMIGRLKDNLEQSNGSPGSLARLFKKYDFAKRITYRNSRMGSDQRPFGARKVPNVTLHTGLHNVYHTTRDDAHTLDYEGLDRITDYAYDIIMQVVGFDYKIF